MGFTHEKPDVYRAAVEHVGQAYRFRESLKRPRNSVDQTLRVSPLNLAEGNGKATDADETWAARLRGSWRSSTLHQVHYTVGIDTDSDTDPDTEGENSKEQ